VHRVTGEFDLSRPDVARDLQNPARPSTAFGLVVEALRGGWGISRTTVVRG
jgi:mannitol 2-dehydrogenase